MKVKCSASTMDIRTRNLALDALFVFNLAVAAICLAHEQEEKKRKVRRWWVRPINREKERLLHGCYHNLFNTLRRTDHEEFFEFTRMWPGKFEQLLAMVEPFLRKTSRRAPLPTALRLAVTLSLLAHGSAARLHAWFFRIGRSTAYKMIPEVCEAIWEALQPTCLPAMNQERWLKVIEEFMSKWQFPNCLGAVDGKHIRIKAPPRSGTQYFNYKKFFSLVLMASCDAHYRFTWIDVGQYGSLSDGGIWSRSAFGNQLDAGNVDLPGPQCLPSSDVQSECAFVGDEAFPLKKFMHRPYARANLGDAERIYNYRLSRARRTIENAFGVLSARWQIFGKSLSASPDTVTKIVQATVCLHNFIMCGESDGETSRTVYCPSGYIDSEDSNHQIIEGQWRQENVTHLNHVGRLGSNHPSRSAEEQRNCLRDYFVSEIGEDQAPWQYACAFQGLVVNMPDQEL